MNKIDLIIPCFNPSKELITCVQSCVDQIINKDWELSILLINDASTKTNYIQQIRKRFNAVSILDLETNQGRSGACDYGARVSSAEILVFLDADCVFNNNSVIEEHRRNITKGYGAFFGRVDAQVKGDGFWNDYFQYISNKRNSKALNYQFMELTTANFSIKRSIYLSIGGFGLAYKHYGFEDRDLINRLLLKKIKIGYNQKIQVYHEAILSLKVITEKMRISGQYSSRIFSKKYPNLYRDMPYGKIDACLHPLLKYPIQLSWLLISKTILFAEKFLGLPIIPFYIKRLIVLFYSTVYFSKGTLMRCNKTNQITPSNRL